jgi:Coenzyme PQQ synthesis protein D (PqqD)
MAWKRLGTQIVAQANEAEVMLADLHLGVYYTIGGSGAEMWNAIDSGCSREQIVRRLESIYEASPETLEEALTEFVDNLVDFDLIRPSGALVEPKKTSHSTQTEKRPFVAPVVSKFKRSDPQLFEKCKDVRWQPATPQVAWKLHGRDLTIVHVQQGLSYKLAGIAKDIWLGIAAGNSRQASIEVLSKRFAVSKEQVASDLDEFTTKLLQCYLLQPAESETTGATAWSPSDATVWQQPQLTASEDKIASLKWISTSHGWEVATPRMVAEVIDDEVIIVDLKDGTYHSITGPGTVIWQALAAGQLHDEVVNTLQQYFDIAADGAAAEVDSVVSKLVEHALLRPRQSTECQTPNSRLPIPSQKAPFEQSEIAVYRDMEDVLRLDPVHDFGEYGWPKKV